MFLLICQQSFLNNTLTDSENLRICDLNSRRKLLDAVVTYYKLHADNVRDIKSIDVLREIF